MSQLQQTNQNQIADFRPRLPYHAALKERFGIEKADWNALVDAIFPTAKTAQAVILALSYCRARKLDPFKKPVHIVPIWDKERRCEVETVWPGIGEHRITASRTKIYAGHDKIEHGPMIEQTWPDGEGSVTVRFPEWAQMTVYKLVGGVRCPFPGPEVYWLETYAEKKGGCPNKMWQDRPIGQIDKCCEAAALRGAFPEEIGGDELTEVEASGRNWHGRPAVDVTPQTTATVSRAAAVIQQAAAPPQTHQDAPESTPQSPDGLEADFSPPANEELPGVVGGEAPWDAMPEPLPDDDETAVLTQPTAPDVPHDPASDRVEAYRQAKAANEAKAGRAEVTIVEDWKHRISSAKTNKEVNALIKAATESAEVAGLPDKGKYIGELLAGRQTVLKQQKAAKA